MYACPRLRHRCQTLLSALLTPVHPHMHDLPLPAGARDSLLTHKIDAAQAVGIYLAEAGIIFHSGGVCWGHRYRNSLDGLGKLHVGRCNRGSHHVCPTRWHGPAAGSSSSLMCNDALHKTATCPCPPPASCCLPRLLPACSDYWADAGGHRGLHLRDPAGGPLLPPVLRGVCHRLGGGGLGAGAAQDHRHGAGLFSDHTCGHRDRWVAATVCCLNQSCLRLTPMYMRRRLQ